MVSTLLSVLGKTLQIFGLATISYVVLLFFGKTGMKTLLEYTIVGIVEFYGGYFILIAIGKKT